MMNAAQRATSNVDACAAQLCRYKRREICCSTAGLADDYRLPPTTNSEIRLSRLRPADYWWRIPTKSIRRKLTHPRHPVASGAHLYVRVQGAAARLPAITRLISSRGVNRVVIAVTPACTSSIAFTAQLSVGRSLPAWPDRRAGDWPGRHAAVVTEVVRLAPAARTGIDGLRIAAALAISTSPQPARDGSQMPNTLCRQRLSESAPRSANA